MRTLFFRANRPRRVSAQGAKWCWLRVACKTLGLGHVTPHGLRSYFVTRARESGLTDAEIASLIGDKTGPAIIPHTYGDVRPEHLLKQAQRIKLTATQPTSGKGQKGSNTSSNTSPDVAASISVSQLGAGNAKLVANKGASDPSRN